MVKNNKLGLFILRIGLGLFLLIWGIDKFIDTEGAMMTFKMFYKIGITAQTIQVLGTLEIVLALLIMGAVWKKWTYLLGLAVHTVSTASSIQQMLPWNMLFNNLFIAGIPVLAGFIALYLLKDKDTLWTVKI